MGLSDIARRIFGSPNDRKIKSVGSIVAQINGLEPDYAALSDAEIRARTARFRERVAGGEGLESVLPEAFANAREAGRRALGLRAFDVQLVGSIFLHRGDIAEMKTGEGKTLVATLPAYLNALTGGSVHVVTVNDYLAQRDADWMGKIYEALGVSVGVAVSGQDGESKRAAYEADILYATNNELGFDYLRDNMATSVAQMVQRGHAYAIIDEVDSILVDEARTPLIISGPSEDRSELYQDIDRLIPHLEAEHYSLDEKTRNVTYTDAGNEFLEGKLNEVGLLNEGRSLYDPESTTLVHHLTQALRAHKNFQREKDYILRDDQVILIDEFTGRMMPGRRLSNGLHQAIEAKENVSINPENVTLASITFQNYFRLYDKLAGMTGTAATEADEFTEIYNLGVVEIPTNLPVARVDEDDKVYRTAKEKNAAIIESIREAHGRSQPILVGTTSIEKSEMLSGLLDQENIKHNVLNARHHEQEAQIIAEAGCPDAVTIATNMAGRGTDIQLGGNVELKVVNEVAEHPERDAADIRREIEASIAEARAAVLASGGLYVLATERHESRRIDNQLRGRSGRQGDPGRTSFFLSLEDDLMRIFGAATLDKVLGTLGMEDGEAIEHPWVSKSLEKSQAKVEARNFDIRKQLLKYDDVMNDQRKVVFAQRLEIMDREDVPDIIRDMRQQLVDDFVDECVPPKTYPEQWDMARLRDRIKRFHGIDQDIESWADEDGIDDETVRERLYDASDHAFDLKTKEFRDRGALNVEQQVLLTILDAKWREHLVTLEHLRSVIGFRGYAQRDPLNEFKSESFELFERMLTSLRTEVSGCLTNLVLVREDDQNAARSREAASQPAPAGARNRAAPARPAAPPRIGRNDLCPCGSGKKYKHCHGRNA